MAVPDIKSEVGAKVRKYREKHGWSQEELGFEADLHRNYIGGVERGERNIAVANIEKLARALGIRPRDLLP